MKYLLLTIFFATFVVHTVFAQQLSETDSIQQLIVRASHDTVKVLEMNKLAMKLYRSEADSALRVCEKALQLAKKIRFTNGIARSYKSLGICYYVQSNYEKSLDNYLKSIEMYEKVGDLKSVASLNNNMGIIYWRIKDYSNAVAYYHIALRQMKEVDDTKGYAAALLNMGAIYGEIKRYDSAAIYYIEAKKIKTEIDDKVGVGYAVHNLGYVLWMMNKIPEAIKNYYEAIAIYKSVDDQYSLCDAYISLGGIYTETGKYSLALKFYLQADSLSKSIGSVDNEQLTNKGLYELYSTLGDYKKAFEHLLISGRLKDSIFSTESTNRITEMQTKYESEKKEKENELLREKQSRNEAVLQRQRAFTISAIGGLLSAILLVVILLRSNKLKKKANFILSKQKQEIQYQRDELQQLNSEINQQKEEIEAQRDNLELLNGELENQKQYVTQQRDTIMLQNKSITDSIIYAKRIQDAIFPSLDALKQLFADSFIFWKPRDIVSGDFYWFRKIDHLTVVAIADCTGHGVPGAFMSMLGVAFLNEIVYKRGVVKASQILEELRTMVISALQQSGNVQQQKDGMDISLCVINQRDMKLQFAGAYNPLYIVRNNQLTEYKADKMPIGIYFKNELEFTNNEIEIQKNDHLYLFSDGFVDQFGGEHGRKYLAKQFKQKLIEMQSVQMTEQKLLLENELTTWQGDKYEQIDDIMVLGIRVV